MAEARAWEGLVVVMVVELVTMVVELVMIVVELVPPMVQERGPGRGRAWVTRARASGPYRWTGVQLSQLL